MLFYYALRNYILNSLVVDRFLRLSKVWGNECEFPNESLGVH